MKRVTILATLTIEDDDDILIGDTDQRRNWFWNQLRENSYLMVGGDLGEQVGPLTDIRIRPEIEKPVFGLSDEELALDIANVKNQERLARNKLSELRLHELMRRHVKREYVKDEIRKLQKQLEAI